MKLTSYADADADADTCPHRELCLVSIVMRDDKTDAIRVSNVVFIISAKLVKLAIEGG